MNLGRAIWVLALVVTSIVIYFYGFSMHSEPSNATTTGVDTAPAVARSSYLSSPDGVTSHTEGTRFDPAAIPDSESLPEATLPLPKFQRVFIEEIPVEAQFALATAQLIVKFDDGEYLGLEVIGDAAETMPPRELERVLALHKGCWDRECRVLGELATGEQALLFSDPAEAAEELRSRQQHGDDWELRPLPTLAGQANRAATYIIVNRQQLRADPQLQSLRAHYTEHRNTLLEAGLAGVRVQRFRPQIARSPFPEEFLDLLREFQESQRPQ